jgi:hypothetical protein
MRGGVLVAQGKLSEALQAYRTSLAITERLAKANPDNASWQQSFADVNLHHDSQLPSGGRVIATVQLASALFFRTVELNRSTNSFLSVAYANQYCSRQRTVVVGRGHPPGAKDGGWGLGPRGLKNFARPFRVSG